MEATDLNLKPAESVDLAAVATITRSGRKRSQPLPIPVDFVPLPEEKRTHVSTELVCVHLNRSPQTVRLWACKENGPIRPIRVFGRLAWPVARIRELLQQG